MPRNMGTVPTVHQVLTGYRTHAEGNTNTTHLTLGVLTHKSPGVGEVGKPITASSIQRVFQSTEGSALVYFKKKEKERENKREEKKKKSIEKKRRKEKKKRERSEQGGE